MSHFHEFPKMVYAEGREPVVVSSQEEHDALGEKWSASPVPSAPNRGDKLPVAKQAYPKWVYSGDMGTVVSSEEELAALGGVWQDDPLEPSEALSQRAKTSLDNGTDVVNGADPVEGVRNRPGRKPKPKTYEENEKATGEGEDIGGDLDTKVE